MARTYEEALAVVKRDRHPKNEDEARLMAEDLVKLSMPAKSKQPPHELDEADRIVERGLR